MIPTRWTAVRFGTLTYARLETKEFKAGRVSAAIMMGNDV